MYLAEDAGTVNKENINNDPTICAVTLTVHATSIKNSKEIQTVPLAFKSEPIVSKDIYLSFRYINSVINKIAIIKTNSSYKFSWLIPTILPNKMLVA